VLGVEEEAGEALYCQQTRDGHGGRAGHARAREIASVTGEASSQARASSVDGSGEAECGARRPDG
jgi:hypothetical protein